MVYSIGECVRACTMAAAFCCALCVCVHFLADALYRGGTSMSVRKLREMTAEEVGRTLAFVCYILADVVVAVGTEVPTMCL